MSVAPLIALALALAAGSGPGKPRVHLGVAGGKDVHLYEVSSKDAPTGNYGSLYGIDYRVVCTSPCDKEIDGTAGQDFFLGRSPITASRRFTLETYTRDATFNIKPGNKGLRIAGAILLGLGAGLTVAGIIFTIPQRFRSFGVPMLGSGLGALVIGVPMMVFGRTRFKVRAPLQARLQR